ncbi:hypothetical protein A2Y83_01530 [Candidatus Falkowbacteria bacterium RBG_13_39_14]|uniref:ABC transporter domain-containing protein n=1 Tax=Candidatus Falkowbacteria bacterium RBG_13_39_14 TaxID=1797985 RepID=A0A1F5S6Q1_9BACT|nr:MAG: hypothetical protein A2Y83_01530 [Candidatus Falkowbacteria bacterium RBG_13_39_14]
MTPSKPIIKTNKLAVTYFAGLDNEARALQDINIEIHPGEFIILFGPSGCGKSTLLYSIAGLQPNVQGSIFFYDKDIILFSKKELENYHQKKTGMVFQAFYLINSVTVEKNVMLPQIALGAPVMERKKRTMELLAHFGVAEQAGKLPLELSGGQQQRVAICRALINEPEILLADEPVGNLDTKSAHDVMLLLQELNQKQKKTVVLVTHDPSYLDYGHRVFHMRDGRIMRTDVNESVLQIKKDKLETPIPKELELLVRTYSSLLPNNVGSLLIPFKAKQIISEILTGMPLENIERAGKAVENLLINRASSGAVLNYFDKSEKEGGLGMDKRTAAYLANEINGIAEKIRLLERHDENGLRQEIIGEIRGYLLDYANVSYDNTGLLEKIIKTRLENKFDKNEVEKYLDMPIKEGGAGLDKRTAKKMAQRLELLMLGKYK